MIQNKIGDDMDYGKLVEDSFSYTKTGLWGYWIKCILIIILAALPFIWSMVWTFSISPLFKSLGLTNMIMSTIIPFVIGIVLWTFFVGFCVNILRGEKLLPEIQNFGALFINGIKYTVVAIIYSIPLIIVLLLTVGVTYLVAILGGSNPTTESGVIGSVIIGGLLSAILAIILALFAIIGFVRFARTGNILDAFKFSEILSTIRKIGWISYIIGLIILLIILFIIVLVIAIVTGQMGPGVPQLTFLIIMPFISIFALRYICLIYDIAGAA